MVIPQVVAPRGGGGGGAHHLCTAASILPSRWYESAICPAVSGSSRLVCGACRADGWGASFSSRLSEPWETGVTGGYS